MFLPGLARTDTPTAGSARGKAVYVCTYPSSQPASSGSRYVYVHTRVVQTPTSPSWLDPSESSCPHRKTHGPMCTPCARSHTHSHLTPSRSGSRTSKKLPRAVVACRQPQLPLPLLPLAPRQLLVKMGEPQTGSSVLSPRAPALAHGCHAGLFPHLEQGPLS